MASRLAVGALWGWMYVMGDWEWREIDLTRVAFSEFADVLAGLERAGWEIETVGPEGSSGRLVAQVRRRHRGVRILRPLAG